jgi:hypothetical protein
MDYSVQYQAPNHERINIDYVQIVIGEIGRDKLALFSLYLNRKTLPEPSAIWSGTGGGGGMAIAENYSSVLLYLLEYYRIGISTVNKTKAYLLELELAGRQPQTLCLFLADWGEWGRGGDANAHNSKNVVFFNFYAP